MPPQRLLPIQVNGLAFSYASLRCGGMPGSGLLATHCRSVSYSHKVTPTMSQGVHGIPLTTGLGFYRASGCSVELYLEAWQQILAELPSGYSAMKREWVWTLKNPIGPPFVVRWKEAQILGPDSNWKAEDSGGMIVKIDVNVRYILENEKCPYPIDLDNVPQ